MSDETKDNAPSPFELQLEPLPDIAVDPNVGYQPGYYPGISQRGDSGLPMPDRDGLKCPSCGYDVRGLTGRTCPECGSQFTLLEARRAGLGNSPSLDLDRRAIRIERLMKFATYVLLLAGLFAKPIVRQTFPRSGAFGLQLLILWPFVFGGMIYAYGFRRTRDEGMFLAVLLYAVFSIISAAI